MKRNQQAVLWCVSVQCIGFIHVSECLECLPMMAQAAAVSQFDKMQVLHSCATSLIPEQVAIKQCLLTSFHLMSLH